MFDRDEKQDRKHNADTAERRTTHEAADPIQAPARTRPSPARSDAELLQQIAGGAPAQDYADHIGRVSGGESRAVTPQGAAPRSLSAYEYATGKPPGAMPLGRAPAAHAGTDLAIGPATTENAAAPSAPQTNPVVTTDLSQLEFNAVVGRQTLPEAVEIDNFSGKVIGIDASIEPGEGAGAFRVWEGNGVLAPPSESTRPKAKVSVRFLAPTAGRHAATLQVRHDFGILRIPLVGTAMDIGTHAKTESVAGSPEPIHDLPARAGEFHTRAEARSQLLDAADAVSSLATTFDDIVPNGDQAAREFGQKIIDAAADLNRRILEWATDEGKHKVHQASVEAQSSGGAEFIKSLAIEGFDKVAEVASDEDPVIGLGVKAVDWGMEVVGLMKPNQEESEREGSYGEHMERVAFFGTRAIDATTNRLAHGFAGLMSRYAVAKDHLEIPAGAGPTKPGSAGHVLGRIQQELTELDHGRLDRRMVEDVLGEARATVKDFQSGLFDSQKNPKNMVASGEWAKALAAIAEAGTQAEEVANAGYAALLDRYIQFRAGGGAGNLETRGGEVKSEGFIDFSERANIQLEGFTFGKYADTSPTVQGFIGAKSLADLAGWDVHIELRGVRGGTVSLHQGPAGPSQRDAKVSSDIQWNVDQLGGVDRIWQLLDGATLGTNTIWAAP